MFRTVYMTAAILAATATESSAIGIAEATTGEASMFAQAAFGGEKKQKAIEAYEAQVVLPLPSNNSDVC